MTPLELAMQQRREETARALENPGALARGFAALPGSVYQYATTTSLPEMGRGALSLGKAIGSSVAKDPAGFAADALFAPWSALRDVSQMRAEARKYRAMGDNATADKMEQLAAVSAIGGLPFAGALVKRGVGVATKAAKKAASLAVKPAEAAAEKAPLAVERGALNIKRDNPGGDWLKGKQEDAEAVVRKRGNIGASGPITAWSDAVSVDPAKLSEIPGSMGEIPTPGNPKYDALLESMSKKGFDPKESGPLLVGINHRGEPHIIEGNNRAAVARDLGVKSVPAEFRWFAGGEDAGGFGPEHIEDMLSPVSKARGGRVSSLAVKRKGKK